MEIVRDWTLSPPQKRALLASWASDARAVPDHPALRRLDDGRIVEIDDVLDALKALDRDLAGGALGDQNTTFIRRGHWSRLRRLWRRNDDDDDDNPPTAPAPVRPYRPMAGGALAAVA